MSEILNNRSGPKIKKFTFRGLTIDQLGTLKNDQLVDLFNSRQKRRFLRGTTHTYRKFLAKIRDSKSRVQTGEKPEPVKTHMRNGVILPEMVGSVVGIHNGKDFRNIEIKFDMIGSYLGEYSLTYKPVEQGKPAIKAVMGSDHIRVR